GKVSFMGAAAVRDCDQVSPGQHLGFILDPRQCSYDPTRDATVLCNGEPGHGGIVGTSTSPNCVRLPEAIAMNKIWYGQTGDGTSPEPAADNASGPTLSANQLWWGLTRGTIVLGLAGSNPTGATPFTIATDMVALEKQDPTLATPTFMNATGNGMNRWKQLSYGDL